MSIFQQVTGLKETGLPPLWLLVAAVILVLATMISTLVFSARARYQREHDV